MCPEAAGHDLRLARLGRFSMVAVRLLLVSGMMSGMALAALFAGAF
jgi:hypothetical protein